MHASLKQHACYVSASNITKGNGQIILQKHLNIQSCKVRRVHVEGVPTCKDTDPPICTVRINQKLQIVIYLIYKNDVLYAKFQYISHLL